MSTSTKVREHPILMSAEMVRARRAGLKTQTRRIIRPQPKSCVTSYGTTVSSEHGYSGLWTPMSGEPADCESWCVEGDDVRCPFGVPGDRLWVRESCWIDRKPMVVRGREQRRAFFDDGTVRFEDGTDGDSTWVGPSSDWTPELRREYYNLSSSVRRTSSIHMPRWACRDVATLVGVRVERVQAISEEDAIAEGCEGYMLPYPDDDPTRPVEPREEFAALWKRINGPDSWDSNPWVWVLELAPFKETSR